MNERQPRTDPRECGVMGLCELRSGHEGKHSTSVDRAIAKYGEASRGPDLAGLRALSAAATPGPWRAVGGPTPSVDYVLGPTPEDFLTGPLRRTNAALIAAAVNYVRAVLGATGVAPGPRCDDPDCIEADPRHEHGWGLGASGRSEHRHAFQEYGDHGPDDYGDPLMTWCPGCGRDKRDIEARIEDEAAAVLSDLRKEVVHDFLDPCFCDDLAEECVACSRIRGVLALIDKRLEASRD